MADKVTYYAIVNDLEQSRAACRSVSGASTSKPVVSVMRHSAKISYGNALPSLVSAERGDLQNEFIEITEEEANQIVARIRANVTGASST